MRVSISGSGHNPENGHVVDPTLEGSAIERPALFNTEMVRAVLARRKRQTRRLIVPQPPTQEAVQKRCGMGYGWLPPVDDSRLWRVTGPAGAVRDLMGRTPELKCPFGRPGDVLWCRETFADVNTEDGPAIIYAADNSISPWRDWCKEPSMNYEKFPGHYTMWWTDLLRRDEHKEPGYAWRPSIHMPRWACRLLLNVTGVRIERLQDITSADIIAEGIEVPDVDHSVAERPDFLDAERDSFARAKFRELWDGINTKIGTRWADNPYVWVVEFEVAK